MLVKLREGEGPGRGESAEVPSPSAFLKDPPGVGGGGLDPTSGGQKGSMLENVARFPPTDLFFNPLCERKSLVVPRSGKKSGWLPASD